MAPSGGDGDNSDRAAAGYGGGSKPVAKPERCFKSSVASTPLRAPGAGRSMRHSRALGGCARVLAPLAPLELRRGRKPCQLWTHHVPGVNLARGVVLVSDATRLCVLNSKAVVECRSSGGGLSLTAESGRARKRHHAEATPLTAAQPSPRHTSRRRSYLEPRLPWRPLSW